MAALGCLVCCFSPTVEFYPNIDRLAVRSTDESVCDQIHRLGNDDTSCSSKRFSQMLSHDHSPIGKRLIPLLVRRSRSCSTTIVKQWPELEHATEYHDQGRQSRHLVRQRGYRPQRRMSVSPKRSDSFKNLRCWLASHWRCCSQRRYG